MNLLLLVRSEILDILIMTYLLVYDRYCRKFRQGNDEFVVIYEGEKAKYALTELEGIPAACERTSQHLIYPLILAMGCAIRMKGENLQDLSKRADDLMYENKQELYRTVE